MPACLQARLPARLTALLCACLLAAPLVPLPAVTGQHADEEAIEQMIETGESEMIFQKAILEQGRGYVMDTLAEIRERRDAGGCGGWVHGLVGGGVVS